MYGSKTIPICIEVYSTISIAYLTIVLLLHCRNLRMWPTVAGVPVLLRCSAERPMSPRSMHGAFLTTTTTTTTTTITKTTTTTTANASKRKNWDSVTTTILGSEKEKSTEEDPNVGGDAVLNGFFQKIFADADDDTRRAMLKSYTESGGTTLSTNWDEVRKAPVEVKPPEGSEWKKWAA